MPALGTLFIAVLLWYIVPGAGFFDGSPLADFYPQNSLLYPSLLLIFLPSAITLISLRYSSSRSEISKRLGQAHRNGMATTLLAWAAALSLGNWFEVIRSQIPVGLPGATALAALSPLFLGMVLTSIPLSWHAGRRSLAQLQGDFLHQGRPYLVLLAPITVLSGIEEWLLLHPDQVLLFPGPQWLIPALLFLLIVILGSPLLLQWMLPSRPMMAGFTYNRLMNLAKRGGIRCGPPRIWNTGSRAVLNAMITGLLPFQRKIFITDQLIHVSSPDELEAVFCHELAHARQGHLWLYLLTGLGFIFTILLFENEIPAAMEMTWIGIFGILFWIFFGKLSHHLEHQADIVSDELTGQPGAIAQALSNIALLGSGLKQRGGWRHPPILERIRVLHHYREDPLFRKKFRQRSHIFLIIIGLLVVVPGTSLFLETDESPVNASWQQKVDQGLSFLHALDELKSRPGGDSQRETDLLLGSEKWIRLGINELRLIDSSHPLLPEAYLTLASIYDQLDQPWEATACRVLANRTRPREIPPDSP